MIDLIRNLLASAVVGYVSLFVIGAIHLFRAAMRERKIDQKEDNT